MLFESPSDARKDKGLTSQTHVNVIKGAYSALNMDCSSVLHLGRYLRTRRLQPRIGLPDMAGAMRWRSVLGASLPYVNVCTATKGDVKLSRSQKFDVCSRYSRTYMQDRPDSALTVSAECEVGDYFCPWTEIEPPAVFVDAVFPGFDYKQQAASTDHRVIKQLVC